MANSPWQGKQHMAGLCCRSHVQGLMSMYPQLFWSWLMVGRAQTEKFVSTISAPHHVKARVCAADSPGPPVVLLDVEVFTIHSIVVELMVREYIAAHCNKGEACW